MKINSLILEKLSDLRGQTTSESDIITYCDIRDVNGQYKYSVVITLTADVFYLQLNKEMNSCTEIAGVPATIYNIENIREAIAFDSKIVLTDSIVLASTLNTHGVLAISCNHSAWAIQEILAFCGAEIIFLPFDKTQQGLLEAIALLLKPYAFSMTYVSASWSQQFDLQTFFSTREKRLFLEMVTDGSRTEYAAWVELEPQAKTGKLSPKIHKGRLVATITKYIPHLVIQNIGDEKNSIYLYINGKYQWASPFFVKAMIKQFFPTRLMNENLINGVFQLLNMGMERLTPFNELNTNEKSLTFQNGLLNLETFELEPHTPELLSTLQLTCNYDPNETNMPNFQRYLADLCTSADGVVDPEKMAVIQEFMGLMLSNIYVYRCKKALLLHSSIGNTGKSVLLNLLGNLLGQSFITNIPLHSMHEGNQFALGNLPGTRAIIVGDSSSNEVKDSALFKQITGGDLLCINQKHRQQFSLKYYGGIILAANCLPTFKDDKGDHMFRRMLIVPCEHVLSEAECDGTLETRIYTEKTAIMNWALEGLKRLLNNNLKFSHCSASEMVIDEYRMTVDSLYRFIQTNYVITHKSADIISKSEFDEAYSTYCSVNGITALNKLNLPRRMESLGLPVAKANIGNRRGIMVYRNIREKTSSDLPFEQCTLDDIPFD